MYKRHLSTVERICDIIAGLLILVMALIIVAQATSRYFAAAMPGVFEGVQLMLTAITFLGLAYTQSKNGHIRMEIVLQFLPSRIRRAIEVLNLFVILLFFMFLTYITGVGAYESWRIGDISMGLISFPLWPSKILVPLGSALLCARLAVQLIEHVMGDANPGEPVAGEEYTSGQGTH